MSVKPVSFQQGNLTMEDVLKMDGFQLDVSKSGDIIKGKVVGYQTDEHAEFVIIGMGSKSEGKINTREFEEKPQIGTEIEALVEGIEKDSGLVRLSKRKLEQARGWEVLVEAQESSIPLTVYVKRKMKQGYLVISESISLFLPHSHLGRLHESDRKRTDPIGSYMTVKILELNARRKTGVVSRKEFQDEQNVQYWGELVDKVKIGDVVNGKIVRHSKVGILVEVEGVQGFLHRSNMSWERHKGDFSEDLPIGNEIQVRVLEVDPESMRFSLGLKQLTEDPWTSVKDKISVGETVKGRVTFVARYGAFIDIGGGLEGLLHISEMSWTRKVNHAMEIVKLDEELEAKVIGINSDDKRISLGLRQLQTNPWDIIRKEYKVGQVLEGKVKDTTNFGVFVSINNEIDALIRKGDLNWDEPAPDPKKYCKKGDTLKFKVIELNFEDKKIGCSIRHILPNPYKAFRDKIRRGSLVDGEVSGIVDFGIFVKVDDSFEGLVHLSAMSKEQSLNYKKLYKKGDKVKVVLKNVDTENRKISLSLKDVEYAMERIEISQYVDKESSVSQATSSPFSHLKSVVLPK